METTLVTSIENEVFAELSSTAYLNKLRGSLAHITAIQTPADYECVRSGIAECRTLRTKVEAKRTELKKPVLEIGRAIDAEAKRLVDMIQGIEQPLQKMKDIEDAARAKAKREKEEIERQEREAEMQRAIEAEQERIRAEQARLLEERQQLERERQELLKWRSEVIPSDSPRWEQRPPQPTSTEPVAEGAGQPFAVPLTEESELRFVSDYIRRLMAIVEPSVSHAAPMRIVKEITNSLSAKLGEVEGLLF